MFKSLKAIASLLFLFLFSPLLFAKEDVTALPAVKVQGGKTARVTHIQTSQINKQTIQESPVVTFPQLLVQQQSIVRVTNQSGDNSQTALSLRGFGDNAVANSLILINGFPLTNVSLLAPNLNSIALADIERIDIIQGSRGVLWGDQAVGGVVNIVTHRPDKWIGKAGFSLGSFKQRTGYILAADKFNNGVFLKAVGFGFGSNQYRIHNREADGFLSLNAGFEYAKGIVQLFFQDASHRIEFPGGLTAAQYHHNPRQASNFTNAVGLRSQSWQMWHQHAWSDNLTLETRLAHQNLWGEGFIFSAFNRREWEDRFSPRLQAMFNSHRFVLGTDLIKNAYSLVSNVVNEKTSETQQHIFIQDQVSLSDTLSMTLGLRAAKENDIGGNHRIAVTEQGFTFHPWQHWQFYLRRDGNFRFPKANEATWTSTGVLLPQTGVSYETGWIYQNAQHKIEMNLYDLRLQHEIIFDPTETLLQPFGSFQNVDPTDRRGISLSDTWKVKENITLDAQLNYVNARFMNGVYQNNLIPAVPTWTGNVGLSRTWADHWRARYSLLFTGSRYASEDLANQGKRLPAYLLHNIALQYFNSFAEVSFEVGNVFDQRYPTYVVYNQQTKENTYYPGSGRYFLLTLKTSFD